MKGRDGYDFDGNSIRVELSRGGTMGRGMGGMGGGGGGGGGGFRCDAERAHAWKRMLGAASAGMRACMLRRGCMRAR